MKKDLGQFRAVLGNSVVFQHLTLAEMDLVLAASELVQAKPGQLILSEGTPGDGLYVVLEGEVEVFLPVRSGGGVRRPSRVRLGRLGVGRCLGEYGVIDDQPSSASVEPVTPTTLSFLAKARLRKLVEDNDRLGRIVYTNLLRYLISRLRGKNKELDLLILDEKP